MRWNRRSIVVRKRDFLALLKMIFFFFFLLVPLDDKNIGDSFQLIFFCEKKKWLTESFILSSDYVICRALIYGDANTIIKSVGSRGVIWRESVGVGRWRSRCHLTVSCGKRYQSRFVIVVCAPKVRRKRLSRTLFFIWPESKNLNWSRGTWEKERKKRSREKADRIIILFFFWQEIPYVFPPVGLSPPRQITLFTGMETWKRYL